MSNLIELQKNFINLRFGTFIHFNSATAQFNKSEIIDWEYDVENGGAQRQFPFDEKNWNPTALDCKKWAKMAKSAGCKFAALTTKHHEGFALWPTEFSEHCIRNATNKTDVVAEYLNAFREEGIVSGLYFSVLDLTAKIGRYSCNDEQKKLIKGQITELLTNYGDIPFLIVDGWNAPWGGPTYDMLPFEEIDELVKSIQPNCLLMNIGCTFGISGTDVIFYENGAGQDVEGEFHGPGALCQKLTKTWFWRDGDGDKKCASADWVREMTEKYFPMNVNVMINISPRADGDVDDNLVEEFAKIGKSISLPSALDTLPNGWAIRK